MIRISNMKNRCFREFKKTFTIVYLMLVLVGTQHSVMALELERINVGAVTSVGDGFDQSISRISGKGFQIGAAWRLTKGFYVVLESKHLYNTIDQKDAIVHWDWAYWLKIYGYVVYLAESDSIYNVEINPKQTLKTKPVMLAVQKEFSLTENIEMSVSAGMGITWYQRQLFLEETWRKYFASIDYDYKYDFRNYADSRKGFVFNIQPSLAVSRRISDALSLSLGADYVYYIRNRRDARCFPMRNAWNGFLNIQFLY